MFDELSSNLLFGGNSVLGQIVETITDFINNLVTQF